MPRLTPDHIEAERSSLDYSWKVADDDQNAGNPACRGNLIAHIYNFAPGNKLEANARLIAAAPALLHAARMTLPWIGKMISDEGHLSAVMPSHCVKAMNELQAAIALAEGREPCIVIQPAGALSVDRRDE
jgi:hypothetical protein